MTAADFRAWLEGLVEAEAVIPARVVLERLGDAEPVEMVTTVTTVPANERQARESWRTRVWTVPSETRLSVTDAAEALNRPKSYLYARTGPAADERIPHRKLDGSLCFTAGELRAWIRSHEHEVVGGPMAPPALKAAA